jgi:hypothetical protein
VLQYWIDGRARVPDQRNELIELTHLDDGQVQIVFWLRGTPTTSGKPFEVRLWARPGRCLSASTLGRSPPPKSRTRSLPRALAP